MENTFWTVKEKDGTELRPMAGIWAVLEVHGIDYGKNEAEKFAKKNGMVAVLVQMKEV